VRHQLALLEPGKPTQNSHIESFNGRFRDACLNQNYWKDLAELRKETSEYRRDDKRSGPIRRWTSDHR
jgi:hypothetical protein